MPCVSSRRAPVCVCLCVDCCGSTTGIVCYSHFRYSKSHEGPTRAYDHLRCLSPFSGSVKIFRKRDTAIISYGNSCQTPRSAVKYRPWIRWTGGIPLLQTVSTTTSSLWARRRIRACARRRSRRASGNGVSEVFFSVSGQRGQLGDEGTNT